MCWCLGRKSIFVEEFILNRVYGTEIVYWRIVDSSYVRSFILEEFFENRYITTSVVSHKKERFEALNENHFSLGIKGAQRKMILSHGINYTYPICCRIKLLSCFFLSTYSFW